VEQAEIEVSVDAPSLGTGISLRDRHLRGPQFLDSARYPTISFRSTRVERPNGLLIVSGTLMLRGQERDVRATCPVTWANGDGDRSHVRVGARLVVPRLPHGIGVARGLERLNPLLYAIGPEVTVRVEVLVPSMQLLPALLPALGR
jgi:polyisoprenoid-binding protein YceI